MKRSISVLTLLPLLAACEPGSPMTCFVFREAKTFLLPDVLKSLKEIENEEQAVEQCYRVREEEDQRGAGMTSEEAEAAGAPKPRKQKTAEDWGFVTLGSENQTLVEPPAAPAKMRTIRDGYIELATLMSVNAPHLQAWSDFMTPSAKSTTPGRPALVAEGFLSLTPEDSLTRAEQFALRRKMDPLLPVFKSVDLIKPVVDDVYAFCALAKDIKARKANRPAKLLELFAIRSRMVGKLEEFNSLIRGPNAEKMEELACADRPPLGELRAPASTARNPRVQGGKNKALTVPSPSNASPSSNAEPGRGKKAPVGR